jgi:hypothetical protein
MPEKFPPVSVQIRIGAEFFHALNAVVHIGFLEFRLYLNGHRLRSVFQKCIRFGVQVMLVVVYFPVPAYRSKIKAELFELIRQTGNQGVLGLIAEFVAEVAGYAPGLLVGGLRSLRAMPISFTVAHTSSNVTFLAVLRAGL